MTRRLQRVLCWLVLGFACCARAAGPNGTDVGWTVDHTTGQILFTSALASQLAQGEAGWVRVEVSLISGHTNWDATVLGLYDKVVNNAHNAGLQVLMLIDGSSLQGSQANWCANNSENNAGQNGDNPYMEAFATNAVVPIIQHFRDRVKVYELWNEPNSWTSNPSTGVFTGGTFVYPSNFGWLLTRSWEAIHILNQFNDVTLMSGGVFGFSSSGMSYGTAGAQYLDDTYSTGTNLTKGGSFAHTKSNYFVYPLDAVGQHIYIGQGGTVSSNSFRQYEDWVHQALTKYEGANTTKKTFITEFGWQTTNSGNADGVSQTVQDTNLVISFQAIQATPYVQTAIWFQWQDNPAGSLWYGVLDSSGNDKPSYVDYQKFHRYEGILANGTTNSSIKNYFSTVGQSALGNPFDNESGAWVYTFLGGAAQDYGGGSHSNLTVMSSTNGTFELNNLHGLWGFYQTNNGASAFGLAIDSEFTSGSGTRQDFTQGFLTWDAVNQVVWHSLLAPTPTGLAAMSGKSQITLQWNAVTNATSYNVYAATSLNGAYALDSSVVGPPTYTDAPLANGTAEYYEVTAVNSHGESAASSPVNATPESTAGSLPAPWLDADVGSVNLSGNSGYSNGVFSLNGAGAAIGGTNDSFHFVYQPFGGNGAIVARVKSQQNTDPGAKAGVMIRDGLASNSVFAATLLLPGNGSQLQFRTTTGSGSSGATGPTVSAPYWVKLARNGSNFVSSVSPDGTNYTQIGSVNLTMSTNALAGLTVCSHNTNALESVVFDNVAVNPLLLMQNGVLTWSGTYTLQSSTNIAGPYTNATSAVSPYAIPAGGGSQKFFRLHF